MGWEKRKRKAEMGRKGWCRVGATSKGRWFQGEKKANEGRKGERKASREEPVLPIKNHPLHICDNWNQSGHFRASRHLNIFNFDLSQYISCWWLYRFISAVFYVREGFPESNCLVFCLNKISFVHSFIHHPGLTCCNHQPSLHCSHLKTCFFGNIFLNPFHRSLFLSGGPISRLVILDFFAHHFCVLVLVFFWF